MTSQAELKIGVLNTSIASENLGDFIIMEGAQRQIDTHLADARQIHFTSHEKLSVTSLRMQGKVAFNIACGTNLLHSRMELIKQWNLGIRSSLFMKPVVLLGVGWRSHAKWRTSLYTRLLLRKLLSRTHLHAVRDSLTQRRLQEIGISNALNSACPTMWSLTPHHCTQIPEQMGEDVVLTLTDYSQDPRQDRQLIDVLSRCYRHVYLWCQGAGDHQYFRAIAPPVSVNIIPPTLNAYDELLSDPSLSLDYVGTRLHGGIRALQHKRRSLIVAVDHRSQAKGQDFHLPVFDRYLSAGDLETAVRSEFPCNIQLPVEAIRRWQDQFASLNQMSHALTG